MEILNAISLNPNQPVYFSAELIRIIGEAQEEVRQAFNLPDIHHAQDEESVKKHMRLLAWNRAVHGWAQIFMQEDECAEPTKEHVERAITYLRQEKVLEWLLADRP